MGQEKTSIKISPRHVMLILIWFLIPAYPFLFLSKSNILARTILGGLLAFLIWWYPLVRDLSKRRKRYITVANFLALGFTLLFIVPGVYIVAFREEFEAWRPSYTEYYPQALGLVSLAGLAFLLGYKAVIGNKIRLMRPDRFAPSKVNMMHSLFFVAIFLLVGWFTRFYLVSTGTYYHTLRSDYQFHNYGLMVILNVMSSLVPLATYFVFIQFLRKKIRNGFLPAVLILCEILWFAGTGAKLEILRNLISIIICVFLVHTSISKKHLLMGFGALLFVMWSIPFFQAYELVLMRSRVSSDSLEVGKIINYFREAQEGIDEMQLSPIHKLFSRLGDIRSLGAIYKAVPENIDYGYGNTYYGIPLTFIPRIIWPSKPSYGESARIMRKAIPGDYASSPLTLVGEAYQNFSYLGVLLVFFIIGIIGKATDRTLIYWAFKNPWWGALLASMGYRIIWVSCLLGQIISPILRLAVVIMIICLFTRRKYKVSVNRESIQFPEK